MPEFDYSAAFTELKPGSLSMSSFELAEVTEEQGATREGWKRFLAKASTKREIAEDMEELRKVSLNQLIADAGDSNSVGKSQLISQLVSVGKQTAVADGPVFIYSHVPLTDEESYAPAALS